MLSFSDTNLNAYNTDEGALKEVVMICCFSATDSQSRRSWKFFPLSLIKDLYYPPCMD